MKKLHLVFALVIINLTLPSSTATTYTVGDNSGWDISTDLSAWTTTKRFMVGDILLFQYSSTHSVSEVTRENYEGCNTMVALKGYSDGNTTIPLTKAGQKYYVCGNKLHCFGGMKLQVNVEDDVANSPANAPAAPPGSLHQPTFKNNDPETIFPASHGVTIIPRCWDFSMLASLGLMTIALCIVKI